MNKNEKAILIGMTLGDGCVKSRKDYRYNYIQNSIEFIHCEKQKEYIEFKADKLHSIFGGKKPNVYRFINNGYPSFRMMKTDKYFKIIYDLMYPNKKKKITKKCLQYLTPEAIAIWYMDDGNLAKKKKNDIIHSYELYLNTFVSEEEHNIIIEYFKENWDIKFSAVKNNGGYRLRCGTVEARKFIKIVDKYIIDTMKYKTDISKKDV